MMTSYDAMLISWPPSWYFWKIQKLVKIIQKMIRNIENVSFLFKLSISMKKLEIKTHFKKFHVKIVKSGFWKSGCHGNGLNGMGIINTALSSPINLMKSYQISLL